MNESATSVDGNEPGTEKADVDKLSPQALNFQSPLRAVSPVFGSPGHIQAALSQAASPINNSTFSANLRALIGEDETLGAPEKLSVTELADEIARLRGEFQAQTDALALKVSTWRSKDQRDRYRDRELLLSAIRKSATKLKESVAQMSSSNVQSFVGNPAAASSKAEPSSSEEASNSFLKSKIEVRLPMTAPPLPFNTC